MNEGMYPALEKLFSEEEIYSKKPFKVVFSYGFDYRSLRTTNRRVLRTHTFEASILQFTEKAVCFGEAGGSRFDSVASKDAFWMPISFVRRRGGVVYITRPKVGVVDAMRFFRKRGIEAEEEPLKESTLTFGEYLNEDEVGKF